MTVPERLSAIRWQKAVSAERLSAALLFGILVALSLRLVVAAHREHVLTSDQSPLLYHAATLAFNYVDFGFVRRGLAGSVVRYLNGNLLRATALFHVLSAIAVSGVACWVFARLRGSALRKATFALVLVALMLRWAEDAGRTDMSVAALIATAAILVTRGRVAWGALLVGFALAIHETGFIFGIPLLLVLLHERQRWKRIPVRTLAAALAVVAGTLIAYAALYFLPHADARTMTASVQSRLPRSVIVDWGIYFAVSGNRGVQMSICQNHIDPAYLRHALSGAGLIALAALVLRRGSTPRWIPLAAATLVPYAFLAIVANDMSRWAYLGVFNSWLLCALQPAHADDDRPRNTDAPRLAGAALLVALVHPVTLKADTMIYVPAPLVDRIAQRLGGQLTPPFARILERCDPGWRSALDAPEDAAGR